MMQSSLNCCMTCYSVTTILNQGHAKHKILNSAYLSACVFIKILWFGVKEIADFSAIQCNWYSHLKCEIAYGSNLGEGSNIGNFTLH